MWNTLAPPWQACVEEAWAAYRHGSLPIGAAITDPDGRIRARGRNRFYEREAEDKLLRGHRLAHAEMNALLALDWLTVDPHAAILYTTTEPCALCAGAVRMTRLREVRYASRDGAAGGVALFEASPFMRRGGVRVVGPTNPRLEAILVALLTEFALGQADENTPSWCAHLAEVVPLVSPSAKPWPPPATCAPGVPRATPPPPSSTPSPAASIHSIHLSPPDHEGKHAPITLKNIERSRSDGLAQRCSIEA